MGTPFPGWGSRDLALEDMPVGVGVTRGGVPVGHGGGSGGRIPPPLGASGPGAVTYNAFPGHSGAFTAPTYPANLPQPGQWTYGQYAPSPHFATPASAPAWHLQQATPNRNQTATNGFSSTAWQPPERRGHGHGHGWQREVDARLREHMHRGRNGDRWGGGGEDDDDGWGNWGNGHGGHHRKDGHGRHTEQDPAEFGWGSWEDDQVRGRRGRRDTWSGRDARDWQQRLNRDGWGDLEEEEEEDDYGWGPRHDHDTRNEAGDGSSWFPPTQRSRSKGPPQHSQVPAVGRGDWENDMDALPDWHRDASGANDHGYDPEDIEDERHAREAEDRMRALTPLRGDRHRSKSRKREAENSWGHNEPDPWTQLEQGGHNDWGDAGASANGWGHDSWDRERGPEERAREVQVERLRARDREERRQREQRQREARENFDWGDGNHGHAHRGGHEETDWELMDAMGGLSLNGRRTPHHQEGTLHIPKQHKKRSRSLSAHRNPLFDGYHVSYEQHKSRNGLKGGPREEDLPFRPNTWREGYSVRSGGGGVKGWLGGIGGRRGSEVKEINDTVKRTLHPHLSFTPGTSTGGILSPYSPSSAPAAPPISLDLRMSPSLPYSLKSFLPSLNLLELPRSPNPTPSSVDLMQFATYPSSNQMRLFHRRLPWYIDIHAGMSGMPPGSRGGGHVTVWDVIVGLYVGLVGGEGIGGESQVRAEEYWSGEMGDHVDVTPPPVSGTLPGSTPLLGASMGGRKMKRTAREQVSMSWRLRGQLASQIKYATVMGGSGMEDVARVEAAKAEQAELQRGVRRVDWLSVGAYVGGGEGGGGDARAYRWVLVNFLTCSPT
ncbi:hypothetical protein L218DRAFT_1010021 [Marasmius fiardii PR-910]|nr:hypothetical protein L218DRAFT_1010021 [Marasmius fiardii PR-910]